MRTNKLFLARVPGGQNVPAGYIGVFFDAVANAIRFRDHRGDDVSIGNAAPRTGTPVHGVKASATINPAGNDNNFTLTAVQAGVAGNDIRFILAIGGTTPVVSVSGKTITVTCSNTTLASAVITAINNSVNAAALVVAAPSGAVTGVIAAVASTPLTGGVDNTPAKKGDQLIDGTNLYTATVDMTTSSTTGWRKIAHSAL